MPKNILFLAAVAPLLVLGDPCVRFEADAPAGDWRHAMLTGNGTIGAMVEGNVSDELMHLSHAKLYLPMPAEGDKLGRDPFMAACNLRIANDVDVASGYRRSVNFATGECTVSALDGDGRRYRRRVFASRPDNLIAIKIEDPAKRETFFVLDSIPLRGYREAKTFELGVRRFEVGKRDGCLIYRCEFSNRNPWNDIAGYVVALAAGADKSEAFIAIEPIPKEGFAADPFPAMRKRLGAAVADGYYKLLDRHAAVMGEIFGRVSFSLECDDERIAERFAAGRYNIISSTGGDNVPNLQGLWTGSWNEPWSSIFKENGHLPCATAFFSRGNTTEFNESLAKWVERKLKDPRHSWHKGAWKMPSRLKDAYRHTLDEAWLKQIEPLVKDASERPAPDASDPAGLIEALYDDAPVEIVTNTALVKIVRDTIDEHLAGVESGEGPRPKAFELVQFGLAACKLGDADRAEKCLACLTDAFWTKGCGTFHFEDDVFNMDLSGGYPYLVSEMLVHGEDSWARFMPAKPASWRKGVIKGLMLRGAVCVEELSWDGGEWKAKLRFKDGEKRTVTSKDAPLGVVWYEKLK